MRYDSTRDITVNVQVDGDPPGTTPPNIWYNVQNNRSEFFQKILWPAIIRYIIYITNTIRAQKRL